MFKVVSPPIEKRGVIDWVYARPSMYPGTIWWFDASLSCEANVSLFT